MSANPELATVGEAPRSDYDQFARVYNNWLAEDFCWRALPIIERLLLKGVSNGCRILDLCCGTGQMAHALVQRGFSVTGLDASPEMLAFAKTRAPEAEFLLSDAREFNLRYRCAAAISTFNSLAHIRTTGDLIHVFRSVKRALHDGEPFLFDLSMEEAYASKWRGSFGMVSEDHACVVRPSYDDETQIGTNQITLFERNQEQWQRFDFEILQKCHSEAEVRSALAQAGYDRVQVYDAERDLGMAGESGRSFFLCR